MQVSPTNNIFGKFDEKNPTVYVNGAETKPESAQAEAEIVQKAFGDRQITTLYNPTKLVDMSYSYRDEHILKQADLVQLLVQTMRRGIEQDASPENRRRVTIFAHSHGALLTKQALLILRPEERAQVDVYTFAGAVVIPKCLSRTMCNVFHEGDMVIRRIHQRWDETETLDRVLKITKRMRREGISLEQAIVKQYVHDTYKKLDSIAITTPGNETDLPSLLSKVDRFQQAFFGGHPEAFDQKTVTTGLERYLSPFTQYNIEILPSDRADKPQTTNKTGLIAENMYDDVLTEMKAYGHHSLMNCHVFPSFTAKIQEIASDIQGKKKR